MNCNSRLNARGRARRASARRCHDQPLTALTAGVVAFGLLLASTGVASAQALGARFAFPSTDD